MADLDLVENPRFLSTYIRLALITLSIGLLALLALVLPRQVLADGPIYVDKDAPGPAHNGLSWNTAYTDLQAALASASPGDEIWVAEGVYIPGSTRTATFQLKNGVALYGGFGGYGVGETLRSQRNWVVHVTVLSGDIDHNDITDPKGVVITTTNIMGDNAYQVVTGSGTDATTVLDGFTITGGCADWLEDDGGGMHSGNGGLTLSNVTFSGNFAKYGGGIYNGGTVRLTNVIFSGNSSGYHGGAMYNSGSPVLSNVTFSNNSAVWSGGAMYNEGHPVLADVIFRDNSGGWYGGAVYNSGVPKLTNVVFIDNATNEMGGGMYNDGRNAGGSPTLIAVTFAGNSAAKDGGGMANEYYASPTLVNAFFSGNSAGWRGGGMYNHDYSSPILTNVVFSGNSTGWYGGGIANDLFCNLVLTNVTFSRNSAASYGGGGIDNAESSITLTNCILWGNTSPNGAQIYNNLGSSFVTYSLVQGGYSGAGNLNDNPLFVDSDGPDNVVGTMDDNLRLQSGSPAVDAGNNSAVPSDTADLDGDGNTSEPLSLDLMGKPRFSDIADKADTGNGTPPVVDMGAYETGLVSYTYVPIILKNR